jgi:putative redox protein
MVQIEVLYEGDLHATARHTPSGATLTTDAPRDNEGRGESFSPTDLLATALGTCMLTIMGIAARRPGIRLEGARARVTKIMATEPARRIGRLEVVFDMPPGLSAEDRRRLEAAAHTCPVHKSLHPEIEIPVTFRYPD